MTNGLNYEAWARNAVAFIRERGLEGEFSDWCGGWPVPVKATAPMIASAPELLEALQGVLEGLPFAGNESEYELVQAGCTPTEAAQLSKAFTAIANATGAA